jgi:vacuolar-type H+-ATPase subunit H
MKRILTYSALALTLGLSALSPSVMAKTRTRNRHSAEHVAAVKKCNEDYSAALKDARTKKGKDRKDAQTAASKAKRDCLASAPK